MMEITVEQIGMIGTNYYVETGVKDECPCCRQLKPQSLHIGKSSIGWAFSLHVDPDNGIYNVANWVAIWNREGARIVDEYGDEILPSAMFKIITVRPGPIFITVPPIRRLPNDQYGGPCYDLVQGDFS
jgi:hypothetical protein